MDKLGPYELDTIVTGDARELATAIPDESVDLIFTDPVYDRIDDYRWLAETAARVLKPDRACLVWTFNTELPQVASAMCPPLHYRYALHWQRYGPIYRGVGKLVAVITHCLWLDNSCKSQMRRGIADWIGAAQGGNMDNRHKWSKPVAVIGHWLDAFTHPDAIIFDPFTGGGTVPAVCKMLRRRYLAFEIDPATADLARERVRNTQPPLPLDMPDQLRLIPEGAQ